MTNLELIRQKCIETNPEIMELKFGCEVQYRNSEERVTAIGKEYQNPELPGCLFVPVGYPKGTDEFKARGNPEIRTLHILGRPIRLADVLLAMQAQAEKDLANRQIPLPRPALFGKVANQWNLKADDLSKQSEETINFIAELLK